MYDLGTCTEIWYATMQKISVGFRSQSRRCYNIKTRRCYSVKKRRCKNVGLWRLKNFHFQPISNVSFWRCVNVYPTSIACWEEYCDRWKLTVNCTKTKVMIFRKGGRIRQPIRFLYKGEALEIVTKCTYLGIVFTVGGSFNVTFEKLSDRLRLFFKWLHQYGFPGGCFFNKSRYTNCTWVWYTALPMVSYHTLGEITVQWLLVKRLYSIYSSGLTVSMAQISRFI